MSAGEAEQVARPYFEDLLQRPFIVREVAAPYYSHVTKSWHFHFAAYAEEAAA